ncbi:hypothetical protein KEM55_002701 [Ascosphaera atra]|nr:hypothetical protein KEM55_002701 [Ascosphaera atra]
MRLTWSTTILCLLAPISVLSKPVIPEAIAGNEVTANSISKRCHKGAKTECTLGLTKKERQGATNYEIAMFDWDCKHMSLACYVADGKNTLPEEKFLSSIICGQNKVNNATGTVTMMSSVGQAQEKRWNYEPLAAPGAVWASWDCEVNADGDMKEGRETTNGIIHIPDPPLMSNPTRRLRWSNAPFKHDTIRLCHGDETGFAFTREIQALEMKAIQMKAIPVDERSKLGMLCHGSGRRIAWPGLAMTLLAIRVA